MTRGAVPQVIPLEAVLCTANGQLLQLDGGASTYQVARHNVDVDVATHNQSMGCAYTQHPRCVLLPQRKTLAIYDLRSSTQSLSSVLWAPDSGGDETEVLLAATINPVRIALNALVFHMGDGLCEKYTQHNKHHLP